MCTLLFCDKFISSSRYVDVACGKICVRMQDTFMNINFFFSLLLSHKLTRRSQSKNKKKCFFFLCWKEMCVRMWCIHISYFTFCIFILPYVIHISFRNSFSHLEAAVFRFAFFFVCVSTKNEFSLSLSFSSPFFRSLFFVRFFSAISNMTIQTVFITVFRAIFARFTMCMQEWEANRILIICFSTAGVKSMLKWKKKKTFLCLWYLLTFWSVGANGIVTANRCDRFS